VTSMRHLWSFVRRFAGLFGKDGANANSPGRSKAISRGITRATCGREWGQAGLETPKEAYRDKRGLPAFETLLQDVRYGLRGLRCSPGFALTAVLTLTLGIGATSAIFSVAYTLLIRPLPYQDADRLVWVTERLPSGFGGAIAEPDMIAWRERGRPFEAVAGYAFNDYTLTGAGEPIRVSGTLVSANYLSLLGTPPQIGRDLVPADDRPGSPAVVLLSDALWRERFSADPSVVGSTLQLDRDAYTVVGVLSPGFRFPDMPKAPQVLMALRAPGSSTLGSESMVVMLQVLAKLRPGASLARTQVELQALQQARLLTYPAPLARLAEGRRMEVIPLQRHLAGDARQPVILLLGAVALVLLIACANIANLQLVRAAARRHEIAVRGALGGARFRLARQLLTESMVISALAASGGLAIGALAMNAIRAWRSPALPWLATVQLDPYVFGFTMCVAILAALLFGTGPAITGSRANLADALKITSLRMSGVRDHLRLRNIFVVGEVALALVLLIAAGLLIRSFRDLMRTDPGYDPRNVLTATIQLPIEQPTAPAGASTDYHAILTFASELLPQLNAVPGVRQAALSGRLPLQHNYTLTAVWFGTAPPREGSQRLRVPLVRVTPDLFRALGVTVVQGRAFREDDDERARGVVVVNRTFARKFFPDGALGKRLHSMAPEHCADCIAGKPAELEVVGITADVRQLGLDHPVEPEIYVPFAQAPSTSFHVVLSTNGNPGMLSTRLRSTVFALSHQAPVYDIETLEQRLSEALAQRRLTMFLLSAFAGLAMLLAAIGVYGVISYAVAQRTQEIGIRLALGATRATVLRLVLRQQAQIILLGSAAGIALALALTGLLSSLLYGVAPRDPITFVLSWFTLTVIALLASAAPALRATRTDPSVTLRYE
jgi:putative ABC transport system permease protein